MHLIELFIPLGKRERAMAELETLGRLFSEKFGGATLFVRSPGDGLWKDKGHIDRDEVAIVEVMARSVDRRWWRTLRKTLEAALEEEEILIRVSRIRRL